MNNKKKRKESKIHDKSGKHKVLSSCEAKIHSEYCFRSFLMKFSHINIHITSTCIYINEENLNGLAWNEQQQQKRKGNGDNHGV